MTKTRKWVTGSIVGLSLVITGITIAQGPPEHDINPNHHPNLAAAQRLCDQAFERINEAQRVNEWDMNGHAKRAKELLDEASREMKLAAESANHHR